MIFLDLLSFLGGLFLLYIGAELLVRGSSRIALLLRISPIIVGLTIVAFGTSSPEFLVSFVAAYNGNIEVSVGNIVGSNIANIGLVLGLSALLLPIMEFKDNIRNELFWVTGTTFIFWIFSWNNVIGLSEGVILFAGIILFTIILIRQSMHDRKENFVDDIPKIETGWAFIDKYPDKIRILIFSVWAVAGIIVLGYGSDVTISAAVSIATKLGISQVVIGLTMVAFGTSLPELATGIISVFKKENEILIGNVIGSNIFNILGVAGPIAIFFPIPISEHLVKFDFPVMLVFTLVVFVLMIWKNRISRISAAIFFTGYIAYIIWVIFSKA